MNQTTIHLIKKLKRELGDIGLANYWRFIINTTQNTHTGYSPFDILFNPAINPYQLRLDKLGDKPKSVKEAHEVDRQQDLNQRILEGAVALPK